MSAFSPDLKRAAGETRANLVERLLAQFDPVRPWSGRLSSSAVATAVAAFALSRVDPARHSAAVRGAVAWLARTANADGGWGDSPDSPSNLTATALSWCALGLDPGARHDACLRRCEDWLVARIGGLTPDHVARGVLARYGADRTFSAPILTLCALAGRLGEGEAAWQRVPSLPCELAALPHGLFRRLNLTVVSYGVPALVAMGLARHALAPSRSALRRALLQRLAPRLLGVAERMQPENGGYEEAPPLTGFVTMALSAAGLGNHPVARRGAAFLLAARRPDGSWPIDSDLATWLTAQAVAALSEEEGGPALEAPRRIAAREWLLGQQSGSEHPLTFGAPGGWGWTDLPGAMPDADDTSAVMTALRKLGPPDGRAVAAACRGARWLMGLQNRDGGMPTFARGWGKLPFDRSCPDITAHAVEALLAWRDSMPCALRRRAVKAVRRMAAYLAAAQSDAGSWLPLWFGTQAAGDEGNPVYGTARVVASLETAEAAGERDAGPARNRGLEFLERAQNRDGGWGAQPGLDSGIEETGVALRAMAGAGRDECVARGVRWLVDRTDRGRLVPASPIGLYFARLWYSEELYPTVFGLAGLSRVLARHP
jgi:squalene-hopene/tetraprenyl-beta-curcumene cyclase